MRVLIALPSLAQPGGVSSLYRVLALNKVPGIEYFEVTSENRSSLGVAWRLVCTYTRLILRLAKFEVVVVNPSMLPRAVLRDSLVGWLALLARRRLVVFWHGWDWGYFESHLKQKGLLKWWFGRTLQRADLVITLGAEFEGALKSLAPPIRTKFVRESTVADDSFIDFSAEDLTRLRVESRKLRVLFMSRIVKGKGVVAAIRAHQLVRGVIPDAELVIAGDGEELPVARRLVASEEIQGVIFVGHVEKSQKHEILKSSSLLMFPSVSEGLPLVILEGMLYGLPIIAMPVGGIAEVVEDGVNGRLAGSQDPEHLASLVLGILENADVYGEMVSENQRKARRRYVPHVVRARLLGLLENI